MTTYTTTKTADLREDAQPNQSNIRFTCAPPPVEAIVDGYFYRGQKDGQLAGRGELSGALVLINNTNKAPGLHRVKLIRRWSDNPFRKFAIFDGEIVEEETNQIKEVVIEPTMAVIGQGQWPPDDMPIQLRLSQPSLQRKVKARRQKGFKQKLPAEENATSMTGDHTTPSVETEELADITEEGVTESGTHWTLRKSHCLVSGLLPINLGASPRRTIVPLSIGA